VPVCTIYHHSQSWNLSQNLVSIIHIVVFHVATQHSFICGYWHFIFRLASIQDEDVRHLCRRSLPVPSPCMHISYSPPQFAVLCHIPCWVTSTRETKVTSPCCSKMLVTTYNSTCFHSPENYNRHVHLMRFQVLRVISMKMAVFLGCYSM
jgi:hypothetical protein